LERCRKRSVGRGNGIQSGWRSGGLVSKRKVCKCFYVARFPKFGTLKIWMLS
jgi:hypothetical protein